VTAFAQGEIEAYVGPSELGAEDDLEQVIVAFIEGAQRTLDVAVQEIDSVPIAEALARAELAGKSVRLLLEQDYLIDRHPKPRPDPALGLAGWREARDRRKENRDVLGALLHCGVDAHIDFNHGHIFHQKYLVRDLRRVGGRVQRGDAAAVLTGSANLTHTDCHSNLNHVLVIHDQAVGREYMDEFAELYGGEFGRGRLGAPPRTIGVGGVPVKVLFAPDHGPEGEIVKQMLKSRPGGRIDFAVFTFAGSSVLDDAMLLLAETGRRLRGVLDRGQAAQRWAAARWLADSDVELLVPRRRPGLRKLHHKLMVVDDTTVVAGSFNYTEPATLYNDENLLVLGSAHDVVEGVEVDHAACAALTAFFRGEIERIAADAEPWRPPL